ncbi:MAG: hypothetical protein AABW41_03385 [Nanoarchaeota archaeon]
MTYRELHYRIERPGRLDGICITAEIGNENYHTRSEIAQDYRLFIDYTDSVGRQQSVHFIDRNHRRGVLEEQILTLINQKIRYNNGKRIINLLKESLKNLDVGSILKSETKNGQSKRN